MNLGDKTQRAGFVTRQINIQGQTLEEIENRLGFHKGRLSQGAYFLVAEELPSADGFDFAGYSQVASQHTASVYGNINKPNDTIMAGKKAMSSSQWSLKGSDRIVKVIPVTNHDNNMSDDTQYPPGSGIQQWKLTKAINFNVECFVANYPSGRFIPKEGFQAVKYF